MALETQWTTLLALFRLCVCVRASVSMSVSASVCLPPRFNYSSFPVQIQFGFSICLHFFTTSFSVLFVIYYAEARNVCAE